LKLKNNNPARFLEKYNTLIFDMDGVITSEECYWDTAALTVWEMHYGNAGADKVRHIRAELFYDDRLIKLFKERGVNSNWDLAYLVYAFLSKNKNAKETYEEVSKTDLSAFGLYDYAAKVLEQHRGVTPDKAVRLGLIWNDIKDTFQECYWGSEQYYNVYGINTKKEREGLYKNEKPLFDIDDIKTLFSVLKNAGKKLCVGTGRPAAEIYAPLLSWDLYDYFEPDAIINYDDVEKAEKKLGKQGLTKPHPYMFLKAYFGRGCPDEKIFEDGDGVENCLVVGDAGADLMAAHGMGADFAAVLTGVSGESGRAYFEEQGAKYILNDVMELII